MILLAFTKITYNAKTQLAGFDRTAVLFGPNSSLLRHHLLDDEPPVDGAEILLLHIRVVLHSLVFHLLRHDGGGHHAQLPGGYHPGRWVLLHLQPLLRVHDLQACEHMHFTLVSFCNNSIISFIISGFSLVAGSHKAGKLTSRSFL